MGEKNHQKCKIRIDKGETTSETKETLKIKKSWSLVLYATDFENLDEITMFLRKSQFTKIAPIEIQSSKKP